MRHRGPDDSGVELVHESADCSAVVFGATRLAILDLSPNGHQPMRDSATSRAVVHNGEIYNFAALRCELEGRGERFASATDTEVVLRGFNAWGEQAVERFRGMFASAVWDSASRQVFLFRDRLGIKPLYYGRGMNGELLFASEVRALVMSGLIDCAADPAGLDSFLAYGAVRAPRTVLAKVKTLMAGHRLAISIDGAEVCHRRYWDLASCATDEGFDENAGIKVRDGLLDAMEAHLVSDVPIGLFLSGGIDSGTLAALASRISPEPVRTFSLAFDNPRYDERQFASAIAKQWNTDHCEHVIAPEEAPELLTSAFEAMDQPSVDGFNSFAVARLARAKGLKVTLSGLGGDEVFGGYSTFSRVPMVSRIGLIASKVPGVAALADSIVRQYGDGQVGPRLARILRIPGTGGRALAAYQLSRELFAPATRAMLMGRDFHDAYEAEDADLERRLANLDPFRQVSLLESELYMGDMLLRDTDVMAMANSLEVRVPLLDHVLIEQVWRFPISVKVPSAQRKALLVGAMGRDIPDAVLSHPKTGFTLPWPEWIASGLRAELGSTFTDHSDLDGVIDRDRARRLGTELLESRNPRTWSHLWALYVADRWLRSTRANWMAASTAS